jgi:hypothetical protein
VLLPLSLLVGTKEFTVVRSTPSSSLHTDKNSAHNTSCAQETSEPRSHRADVPSNASSIPFWILAVVLVEEVVFSTTQLEQVLE